jgi:hypothetical protein
MNNTELERVINLAAKDTKKGERVVAKVFYRILRKRGFSENQIINIATNILNCLIDNIKVNEKKIDNGSEYKKEEHKEYTLQQEKVRTFTKFARRYDDYKSLHYTA